MSAHVLRALRSEKTACGSRLAHPVIWNPVIVIIRVTFITQAIFVMILLPRVGEMGAVVLEKIKGTLKKPISIR